MTKRILARSARLDTPTEPERPVDPERTAKQLARMFAGGCVACGASGFDAELFPVEEGDPTYFTGDELCLRCL